MVWFRVDDKFHSHPKRHRCSLAAIGLWSIAGSWCGEQDKNRGEVPGYMLTAFGGSKKLAAELVAAGLWDVAEDGWRFHDWNDLNPDDAKVAQKREADRVRQEKWRAAKEAKKSQRDNAVTNDVTDASVTHLSEVSRSSPTRPDPTRPAVSTKESGQRTETLEPEAARCAAHQGIEDPGPCRGCMKAREHVEAQVRTRKADAGQKRRDCPLCDDNGMVLDENQQPIGKCDHRTVAAS